MPKTLENLYSHKRAYLNYLVLPENTKQKFSLVCESYDQSKMKPHKPLRQQENINIKLRIPCNKDKVPKAFGK